LSPVSNKLCVASQLAQRHNQGESKNFNRTL